MKKMNWFSFIGLFGLLLLVSCESDDDESGINQTNISLTVEDLDPGSFYLVWDEVPEASWYFLTINKDGEPISDNYDGSVGLQMGLIENGVAKTEVHRDLKAGEEYELIVTATDYLLGGKTIAKGVKEITMPNLPEGIISAWTEKNSSSKNWTFGADGTLIRSDLADYDFTMTWTIAWGNLAITKHFESNTQTERYTYQLSEDGQTLTLEAVYSGMMGYVLEKTAE